MSAYKKLNQQDAYISTYTSRKSWVASGSQYKELGINNIRGLSGYGSLSEFSSDIFSAGNQNLTSSTAFHSELIYDSIKHLYYNEFENAILNTTSSYESYLQSSFETSGSRYLNDRVAIFSLPKEMYGTHIEPLSISITPDLYNGTDDSGSLDNYITNNYATDLGVDSILTSDNLYIENTDFLFGSNNPSCTLSLLDYLEGEGSYVNENISQYIDHSESSKNCNEIIDDGEGRLYFKYSEPRQYVGNVIYTHGQIIITNEGVAMYYNSYFNAILKWKSNLPIFTHNYHCKMKNNEFNYSLNKTILQNSDGLVKNFATGSVFNPYFTTVGLYNDSNQLMAVAKLGSPTPKSNDTDTSVIVKLDMNFGTDRSPEIRVEPAPTGSTNTIPCSMYFTFRNFERRSGAGTNWVGDTRQGTSSEIRRKKDTGGYMLFRKRTLTTEIPRDNIPTDNNWTKIAGNMAQLLPEEFQNEAGTRTRQSEVAKCYVDVQVDLSYDETENIVYTFSYFKSNNGQPGSATYTPGTSDRSLAFFRDRIMSYLLQSRPSCDFDYEPAVQPTVGNSNNYFNQKTLY